MPVDSPCQVNGSLSKMVGWLSFRTLSVYQWTLMVGLSLRQFVFALSEKMKNTACSPSYIVKYRCELEEQHADFPISFTFDDVFRLDQGTSTALVTTREWRNSFMHINRIPLDFLSLTPTHLSHQKDLFSASLVCCRTLPRHVVLWTQLYLRRGEVYTNTPLECAKGPTARLHQISSPIRCIRSAL